MFYHSGSTIKAYVTPCAEGFDPERDEWSVEVMWGGTSRVYRKFTYAALKAEMVKRRYSVDDQIAVMLNRDDDAESALAYEKMQAWREWSGRVAKAIIEKINEQQINNNGNGMD